MQTPPRSRAKTLSQGHPIAATRAEPRGAGCRAERRYPVELPQGVFQGSLVEPCHRTPPWVRICMTSGSWQLLVKQVEPWRIAGLIPSHPKPVEFLKHLLPSQSDLTLNSWHIDPVDHQVTVNLSSTQTVAHCPLCDCPTHRIHSGYERTLKDLPVVQFSLTIVLAVCKFFCLNHQCPRRIFTERTSVRIRPESYGFEMSD